MREETVDGLRRVEVGVVILVWPLIAINKERAEVREDRGRQITNIPSRAEVNHTRTVTTAHQSREASTVCLERMPLFTHIVRDITEHRALQLIALERGMSGTIDDHRCCHLRIGQVGPHQSLDEGKRSDGQPE
jgi:hypothetical protein